MKRRQVIIVAAAAITLGLFRLTYTTHPEPRYQGRSLSQWLALYNSDRSQEAADGIRHIGTNALPFLVAWTQQWQPFTPRKQHLWAKVWSWNPGTPGREFLLELITGREVQGERANWGFTILGETARAAVPDLVRIATHGKDGSDLAIMELGYLGTDAVEPLVSVITNNTVPQRIRVGGVTSLSHLLNSEPSLRAGVVAEFTKLLSDSDASVRSTATYALHFIAPEGLQQSSTP